MEFSFLKSDSPACTKCSNKKNETLARFILKPCIVSAWSATKTTRCEVAQYTESLPTHDVWEGFFCLYISKKDVILWCGSKRCAFVCGIAVFHYFGLRPHRCYARILENPRELSRVF
jgi:hypothetical protein